MEKTNFSKFIKNYCVRIPKIQREYVQGQNERGFSFIEDIFLHIKEKKEISLDLIYGSIQQGNDEKDIFEPIDGQQRLTTLFLLYWYFRHINGNSKVDDIEFIYETRESSKEFCEAICKNKILLNKEIVPSELLTNESWFYEKYRYDYTIKSMIKMLDYIQNVYCNSEQQITLKDLDDYIIFNVHIFKNYTLGNRQYIIMNDRGKQLNAFENFKSAFSKWLNTDNSANNVLEFNKNMDGKWSEELWNDLGRDRDSVKTDNLIYIFFIRFIWCMYAAIPENKNDEYEKIREKLNESVNLKKNGKRKNVVNEIDFKKYIKPSLEKINECRNEQSAYTKKELIEEMTNYLNFLFALKDENAKKLKIEFLTSPWKGKQEKIDPIISTEDFEFKSRVANYGLQLFFEKNDYTKITEEDNAYKEWKRFVWNVIEDSNLDNVDSTITALKILNKYRLDVNNIIEKLSEQNEKECNLGTERREIRKAKYIKNVIKGDEDWRKTFNDAERHQYLKGCIDFLFIDIYNDKKDDFIKRKNNMDFIFSENGLNTDEDHLVLRALLSKYTFKHDSKGKLIIPDIRIFDSESDRGVLKTSIKEEWTEYIKEYLEKKDKKAIIEQMKTDISSCGLQYSEDEKKDDKFQNKFLNWQIELCNNTNLMNFIIDASKLKKSSYASPMHFASSSWGDKIRVYYKTIHNSSTQLWLDTDYTWCVEVLEEKGFKYKNILPGEFEEEKNYRFKGTDIEGKDIILCFGRSVIVYEKGNIEITIHPTKEIKYNNRKNNTFNYLEIKDKEKFKKFIQGDENWNN